MLRKVMNEKVEVVIGGETRVVRQRELVIRGLMNKAMKGDTAAFRAIMELYAVEELEQPNQCSLVIFESELGL